LEAAADTAGVADPKLALLLSRAWLDAHEALEHLEHAP
jgi:hypothetical protein